MSILSDPERPRGGTNASGMIMPHPQPHDQDGQRLRLLAWLPIPIFLLAAMVLFARHITATFEVPMLLATLNTLFYSAVSLLIVLLAARSYRSSGPARSCGWGAARWPSA